MKYLIQLLAMSADVFLIWAVIQVSSDLGLGIGVIFATLAFSAWRDVEGWLCWTPSGVKAFMHNFPK
jgi:hypothetical protein